MIFENELMVFSRGVDTKPAVDNKFKPAKRPSATKVTQYFESKFFTPWGDDNLWLTTVRDALQGCAPAQVCVEILAATTIGNGIGVYKLVEGRPVRVGNPAQLKYLRAPWVHNYNWNAALNYFTSGMAFPQLLTNADNSGIPQVANIDSTFCRLGPLDTTTGTCKHVFISGSWDKMPAESDCAKEVLIDISNPQEAINFIKSNVGTKRFMLKVGNHTPGNLFYDDHPWHALVRTGALDIFPELAKVRKRRIKNAMILKYHVEVNIEYFYRKADPKDPKSGETAWKAMSPSDRQAIRKAVYMEIDKLLSGSDNSFQSVFSEFFYNPRTQQEEVMFRFKMLEAEVGEKAPFDIDKQSGTADILFAFGIPSAVANTVLSDSKSRGGGSDINEGNNTMRSRIKPHSRNIIMPIEFAMQFTGLLGDDEYLDFDQPAFVTLDKNPSGVTSAIPEPAKPAA